MEPVSNFLGPIIETAFGKMLSPKAKRDIRRVFQSAQVNEPGFVGNNWKSLPDTKRQQVMKIIQQKLSIGATDAKSF